MKQRFSSLDIKVIAHELSQTLTSLRVSNIYDLSSRIFLFKFAKPDHRAQLVVDSGFRCHLTSFARTTAGAPSPFIARLRKFLKTRRVTKVQQLGTDRILEIQFSDGQYRLFLEFYAGGNIVLTDNDLKILALHRNVNEGAPHERIRQGTDYNVTERQNVGGAPLVTKDRLRDGLQSWIEKQTEFEKQLQAQGKQQKKGKKQDDKLRKALAATFNEYPPVLLEHSLLAAEVETTRAPEDVLAEDVQLAQVMRALEEADRVMKSIMAADPIRGYIVGKPSVTQASTDAEKAAAHGQGQSSIMYNDFHPFRPKQLESDTSSTFVEFDGYNKTVDEFFSSIEGQKLESRLAEREANAKRKIDNARQDQEKRIGGLQAVQDLNVRKAQALEANLARVEEAAAAINGLIAQGMDWVDIDRLIEQEQLKNNPVAEIIKLPLKLNENTATLLLGEWEEDDVEEPDEGCHTDSEPSDSEGEDKERESIKSKTDAQRKPEDKRLNIDIDLALSAWSNAREYYDQKRTAAAKQEKTVHASTKALKSAQQKIEADLKRGLKQEKAVLRAVRTPMWFEKFMYFISSDGYLVLGARDGPQGDILYKRHMKKGDAFVHADLDGACPMIIKNNPSTPDAPIPPSTLSQAGNMCVCTSSAWDSKAVMSAWWVASEQVSKMAPTGDYLKPGGFHIKGKKNFLPPAQLLLGFGVMWRISEDSKVQHLKHRVPNAPVEVSNNGTTAARPQGDDDDGSASGGSDDEDAEDADASVEVDAATSVDGAQSPEPDEQQDKDGDHVRTEPPQDRNEADHPEEDRAEHDDESRPTYINPLQSGPSNVSITSDEHPTNIATTQEPDEAQAHPTTHSNPETAEAESPGSASDDESEASEADPSGPSSEPPQPSEPTTSTTTSTQPQPQSQTPLTRGARSKLKRQKKKYANQDPEDAAAAMELLGSRTGQERTAAELEAKRAKQAAEAEMKARRKEKMLSQQEAARTREKVREEAAEGQGVDVDEQEEEGATTVDLETLIGAPLPGDEILEGIPVCAPWSSLGRYKYKIKLQPGSLKKGKAVREMLGRWRVDSERKGAVDTESRDAERMWPREVEVLRGWREEECFGVVPVRGCRVMMAGGGAGKGGKGGGGKKGESGARGKKKK